ncbi:hypothetical protein TRV_07675 [Trichophyton verrucosum HKI 0517]|uniref:Uncharacterized protein n=1 Tax=Trichophyton verrucosum (strain HKI 0517) TaxID=663202 RepID=D4DKF3_TRIVH|nr:uncharacterized protein TRV_07675 [Trichophyton verrucosum HKI 0517]EFE37685.1 hypothetical protein TRV_07675 [Trichophyton verrucosum HKI 0517]
MVSQRLARHSCISLFFFSSTISTSSTIFYYLHHLHHLSIFFSSRFLLRLCFGDPCLSQQARPSPKNKTTKKKVLRDKKTSWKKS